MTNDFQFVDFYLQPIHFDEEKQIPRTGIEAQSVNWHFEFQCCVKKNQGSRRSSAKKQTLQDCDVRNCAFSTVVIIPCVKK